MMARSSGGRVAVTPSPAPRAPLPVMRAAPGERPPPVMLTGQRELHRHLVHAEEVEGAERGPGVVRAEGHDVEVHAVELDGGVEHGEAGGGEVDGGELHVVAVEGLLDHVLVQLDGAGAAGLAVAALDLGSDGHEERARAAGEVGHVEGGGEFVVPPVDAAGPAVEDEAREERGGGHGGVVGAGEFGVGEERVEEASGEVVAFEVARLLHGRDERARDLRARLLRRVGEHVEDLGGQLEHGHVVDAFADVAPDIAQAGDALATGLADGGHVGAHDGEAVLEGEGVEEHEAADAEGGGAVLFVIGAGDEVGDEQGDAGVFGDGGGGPLHAVADDGGGGGHAVRALQFEGQGAQLAGQVGHGAAARAALRQGRAARAVRPPADVVGGAQPRERVLREPDAVGVEDAEHAEGLGEGFEALRDLSSSSAAALSHLHSRSTSSPPRSSTRTSGTPPRLRRSARARRP